MLIVLVANSSDGNLMHSGRLLQFTDLQAPSSPDTVNEGEKAKLDDSITIKHLTKVNISPTY